MNELIPASLVLISFGIVLLVTPMQLFERNYPDTIKYIKKNNIFMTILKILGYLFIFLGGVLIYIYIKHWNLMIGGTY
ncbi:hypothetical protein [Terrisporobacter glycolicus]|uniref:hypothetical protein n=1 Tax=Terrisporobacter glycolicus TaxID=36841 RepID=UPI00346472A1